MGRFLATWMLSTFVIIGAAVSAAGDSFLPEAALSKGTANLLGSAVGNADPGACTRLAVKLDAGQLLSAIYRGTSQQQRTALVVAADSRHPWPLLPYMVALMESPHRGVASGAAEALLRGVEREAAGPGQPPDVIAPQVEQMLDSLSTLASNSVLAADVRAAAITVGGRLQEMIGKDPTADWDLLEDSEPGVRAATLALLAPPLDDDNQEDLLALISSDEEPVLRGQAVALLCENALYHQVAAPTNDLQKVILSSLKGPPPAEAVAPVLACLAHFSPESRAELMEAVLKHPDERVSKLWEELKGR